MNRPIAGVLAGLAIILGAGVFAHTAVRALVSAPDSVGTSTPPSRAATLAPRGVPARLVIPVLGIDAPVEAVGVNAAGDMRAPSNFVDTAWYEYGPEPGARGSAVIDGHLDNGLGLAGVFRHLAEIPLGADIYVETASSTRTHFVVEATSTYPYQAVPLGELFNRADEPRLNLITCDGAFLPTGRTYDHRLVVWAVLATSTAQAG
ncbi:MAG: class F sortase [Patescibacteria group bacterium]|nr:class F sortase [Patescibacteria group bacterium]MDE1944306.1 class F sortase [Patescibacteria group bacterium]MDE1945297.1 class F sortase [Patescibacteria group bacterium]MDE2057874.1 class F sortase [Patescibacteria group bacterium]